MAKPGPGQIAGVLSLGLGIVLLIAGDAGHVVLLVLIGLAAGAWGIWRLVAMRDKNTKPPGQT